jgi:ATP-dependent Zn protease
LDLGFGLYFSAATRILAGRAAEELVFGRSGMGCGGPEQSDLAQATLAAARAEVCYGQGGRLTWLGNPSADTLPGILALHRGVGDRVEKRLTEALEAAGGLLNANRLAFDALVDALLERESLSGAEAEEIVRTAGMKVGGGAGPAPGIQRTP